MKKSKIQILKKAEMAALIKFLMWAIFAAIAIGGAYLLTKFLKGGI